MIALKSLQTLVYRIYFYLFIFSISKENVCVCVCGGGGWGGGEGYHFQANLKKKSFHGISALLPGNKANPNSKCTPSIVRLLRL